MDTQQCQPENLLQQSQPSQQQPIEQLPSPPAQAQAQQQPPACPTPAPVGNVVISVPIVPPEDIYTYVAVKGSLHAQDCSIFGLNEQEIAAVTKRYPNGSVDIINGIMIKLPPLHTINALSQLGYKVVCSTGEAEIVWTMQREL